MKKLLFVLFSMSCLMLSAQTRVRTYTFDLSEPPTLSPAVTDLESAIGSSVVIADKVFKSPDGLLSLSFDRGTSLFDPRIIRGMDSKPYMDVPRGASMILSVPDGGSIMGVRVPSGDIISGVSLTATKPEMENGDPRFLLLYEQTYYEWPATYYRSQYGVLDSVGLVALTKDYTSLTFTNSSPASTGIHKIEVDYMPQRDCLVPVANMGNGAVVTSFKGMELTFDAAMQVVPADVQLILTSSEDSTFAIGLSAVASGNVVKIVPDSPVTVDGTYTLTVAAGSFESADGFRNQELTYTFQVLNSFDILGIYPATGKVDSIPAQLILLFDGEIGQVNETQPIYIIDESGSEAAEGKASKNDDKSIKIVFNKMVSDNGFYTLTIPEKLVYDKAGKHFNAKTVYTYSIGDVASAELKATADSLLALTGLGYPTSTDAARGALAALGAKASTADYNRAIAFYLQTTNVEMPVNGKYYYVAAVNKNGQKAYLQYADGMISLTADASKAAPLRTVYDADSIRICFYTTDNKSMQLPGSTDSSIANAPAALMLTKMQAVSGADDEAVFGLFSISRANSYALADVSALSLLTPGGLSFTETESGAFKLELVPDSELPVPDDDFTYDFLARNSIYYKEEINQDVPIQDVYLNDMTLYSYDVEIYPSDKEVVIVRYNTNEVVARGRFYRVDNPGDYVSSAKSVIKLKFDPEITAGSLSNDTYSYKIERGTFGDEFFGLYNSDLSAFIAAGYTKAKCHVNEYLYYIQTVNNNGIATGITDVTDSKSDSPVYDLMGRKVSGQLKSGVIYVRDGRKFIYGK